MSDSELISYIKKVETNFRSHIEKGTIEVSLEYYNLCEELMARGINAIQENKKLKEDISFCLKSIKQEMEMSIDSRTKQEMLSCYQILSKWSDK